MSHTSILFPIHHHQGKQHIRQILRQARKSIPKLKRQQAEQRINRHLKKVIKRNQRIGIYWSIGSEVQLQEFIQAAQSRHAKLYLPYIEPKKLRLWFTPYPNLKNTPTNQNHTKNFNIPQFQGKKIRVDKLHTLLIPVVGIDKQGIRLGQGGGYYDCTLNSCKNKHIPKTIAIAFACQTTAQLPAEPHDIKVSKLICEYGVIPFTNHTATKQYSRLKSISPSQHNILNR